MLSSCKDVREGVVPFYLTTERDHSDSSNDNNYNNSDRNSDRNNAYGTNETTTTSNQLIKTDSDDSNSDSEYIDDDDESTENNNLKNGQNSIKRTHNTFVPSNESIIIQQTFDNLYVKDMHSISTMRYYKDNAFGAEVRVSRRVPIRDRRGGGGRRNRNINRVDGYKGASSSCVCQRYNNSSFMVDLMTQQSDRLKLCSEIDCITSHYLIYYLYIHHDKGVFSCHSVESTETNNIQASSSFSSSSSSSSSSGVNQVKTSHALSVDMIKYLRSHWEDVA
jgi:hypothetical protein